MTDVRLFLDDDTRRVDAPAWPIAFIPDDPYRAPFVRGFGRTYRRDRGPVDEWPSEVAYCDVSHAVRFERRVVAGTGSAGTKGPRIYCAFRRLFWDGQLVSEGSVTGRVEIGFGLRTHALGPLDGAQLGRIIDDLLRQPMSVKGAAGTTGGSAEPARRTSLSQLGPLLAKAYLRASTSAEDPPPPADHDWWVQAGSPAVILEYVGGREVASLPAGARQVPLSGTPFRGITVHVDVRVHEGRRRPVWLFETSPDGYDKDALRRLRINITRLQSEFASLRILSDLERKKRIAPKSERAQRNLRDCLSNYLGLLYQGSAGGFVWTDFVKAAMTLTEALTPGELASLRALHAAPGRGLRAQFDRASEAVAQSQMAVTPLIKWDVFLAHTRADKPIAKALYDLLVNRVRVFFDAESLPPTATWDDQIPLAQQQSFMTVVLLRSSPDPAHYFRSEVQTGFELARQGDARYRLMPIDFRPEAERGQPKPYGLNLIIGLSLGSDELQAAADAIVKELARDRPPATTVDANHDA